MKIKTYRAKDLCEAFAMIREDLGLGAEILETREVRKHGIMGFLPWGGMVEVTVSDGLEEKQEDVQNACCEDVPEDPERLEKPGIFESSESFESCRKTGSSTDDETREAAVLPVIAFVSAKNERVERRGVHSRRLNGEFVDGCAASPSEMAPDSIWDSIHDLEQDGKTAHSLDVLQNVRAAGERTASCLGSAPEMSRTVSAASQTACAVPRNSAADLERRRAAENSGSPERSYSRGSEDHAFYSFGLGNLQSGDDSDSGLLFRDQTRFFHRSANLKPELSAGPAAFQDALLQVYAKLQTADMDELSAASLIERLRNEEVLYAATGKRTLSTDQEFLEKRLQELVAQDIQTSGPIQIQPGTRHVAALVGPTGVGKTTTIAKLAIDYRQRKNCQVGLITLDLSRMGAVEQLQTFADIISIPMLCVSTRRQMREAMARMADFDLVLIDTAGQSRADEMPLQELRMFFDAAQVNSVMLVLSSTSRTRILKKAVQSFESLGTTSLILTKLDEALGLGNLYPLLQETTLPVSYLTNGQKVPDDFETAERMRLARLILGDESCRP
ncbi:MAG: hypothetical protein IJD43_16025 [Thermoguttaceae bacterium]|nr:hypothetical protein [Thermoguttaceae bacterium]